MTAIRRLVVALRSHRRRRWRQPCAAQPSAPIPLPRSAPGAQDRQAGKPVRGHAARRAGMRPTPLALAPQTLRGGIRRPSNSADRQLPAGDLRAGERLSPAAAWRITAVRARRARLRPAGDGDDVDHLAARSVRGQAGDRPRAQGAGRTRRRASKARSPIRSHASCRMGDPAQRRHRSGFLRATPLSSPPIRAGRASSRCAAAPRRRCGSSAPTPQPSSPFSPASRRAPPRAGSRSRARCSRRATVPARRRRCARPGARTASPPISKRRRATRSAT